MQSREVEELADHTLSVELTGDSSKFNRAVASANRAMDDFASRTKSIGKSISSVGRSLTNSITKPATVAATALAGVTLVKGFERLKTIDEAKAKLTALGNSGEDVTKIMESANESVLGTSYALDEAATTAAGAVAAGVKPGKDLTKYLTNAADAAAVAGTSMSEMGSIFNKVQTSQRAYTEELNMLADRGIPIYQWLADEAGTSASAVRDMAADGEISSQMFFDAVQKNIGGAAQIIGETSLTGAISNINASLSRIGANFLDAGGQAGGFFSQVKPLLVELKDNLSVVEEKASELGEKFGAAFANVVGVLEDAKARFEALPEAQQAAITKSAGIGASLAVGLGPGLQAIGSGVEMFGKFSSVASGAVNNVKSVISSVPKSIQSVTGAIGSSFSVMKKTTSGLSTNFKNLGSVLLSPFKGFGSMLSGAITNTSAFQAAFTKLSSVASGVQGMIAGVSSKFSTFKTVVSGISSNVLGLFNNKLTAIGTSVGQKFPKITSIFQKFGQGANTVFSKLSQNMSGFTSKFGNAITPIFSKIGGLIGTVLPQIGSFASVFAKGFNIMAIAGLAIAGLGLLRTGFGDQIDSMIGMVQEKGPTIIMNLVNGITGALPNLILQGGILIDSLLTAIIANIPKLTEGAISIVSSLVTGISTRLPSLIPLALEAVLTLVSSLLGNIDQLVDAGISLLTGLADGLVGALPILLKYVPTIIIKLVSTLISNAPKLLQTGITLLVTLGTGLIDAIPQLLGMLPKIFNGIINAFKSQDWGEIGKNIIDGLINGLKSMLSSLWNTVTDIASDVGNWFKEKLGIGSPSKVFMQYGVWTDEGFAIGIEKGTKEVERAFQNMNVTGTFTATMPTSRDFTVVNTSQGSSYSTDLGSMGGSFNAANAEQYSAFLRAVEKGISGMKVVANNREVGRFMSDIGFQRVTA